MITHLCHVPILNRSIFFVGDCTYKKAERAVFKLKKSRTEIEFTPTANGCVRSNGGDVFVWVKDLDNASVVAHELAHAACSLMEECNIPLCDQTEELMCYLIGWLKINVQDKIYTKRGDYDHP